PGCRPRLPTTPTRRWARTCSPWSRAPSPRGAIPKRRFGRRRAPTRRGSARPRRRGRGSATRRTGSVARVSDAHELRPPDGDEAFVDLATDALDDVLALDPVQATALGDHRFDDRLPDLSAAGLEEARRVLAGWLGVVDSVDDAALSDQQRVDHEILRSAL